MDIEELKMKSVSIQTDSTEIQSDTMSYMYCAREQCDISIQTEIHIVPPPRTTITVADKDVKKTHDMGCGNDEPFHPGFTGFQDIQTDTSLRQLAGVTRQFFCILLRLIDDQRDNDHRHTSDRKLGKENRLLLFLMKLKLGITFCALGCLFQVHETTAARCFYSLLELLTAATKTWIFWPAKASVKENLPESFYNYPNCRCIIDCPEITIDTPTTVEQRVLTYSNYKGKFTVKFLIAISPDGLIAKMSQAYGGRTTDAYITNDSGFLELLEPGDEVLANKGFPQIRSELMKRNAILTTLPFALNPQFSDEEAEEGYNIASVRIHLERSIQRIKLLHILDHIPSDLFPYVNSIMHMCCIIANSLPP